VFPVRYGLKFYKLFRRYSVFKWLNRSLDSGVTDCRVRFSCCSYVIVALRVMISHLPALKRVRVEMFLWPH
jgi:hypothetical protein